MMKQKDAQHRFTIDIPEEFFIKLKVLAAVKSMSMREIVLGVLKEKVQQEDVKETSLLSV